MEIERRNLQIVPAAQGGCLVIYPADADEGPLFAGSLDEVLAFIKDHYTPPFPSLRPEGIAIPESGWVRSAETLARRRAEAIVKASSEGITGGTHAENQSPGYPETPFTKGVAAAARNAESVKEVGEPSRPWREVLGFHRFDLPEADELSRAFNKKLLAAGGAASGASAMIEIAIAYNDARREMRL